MLGEPAEPAVLAAGETVEQGRLLQLHQQRIPVVAEAVKEQLEQRLLVLPVL